MRPAGLASRLDHRGARWGDCTGEHPWRRYDRPGFAARGVRFANECQGLISAPSNLRAVLTPRRPGEGPEAATGASVVRVGDDLAARARHQRSDNSDVDAGAEETHRAVPKEGVGPAGVEAVDFADVGAVERT